MTRHQIADQFGLMHSQNGNSPAQWIWSTLPRFSIKIKKPCGEKNCRYFVVAQVSIWEAGLQCNVLTHLHLATQSKQSVQKLQQLLFEYSLIINLKNKITPRNINATDFWKYSKYLNERRVLHLHIMHNIQFLNLYCVCSKKIRRESLQHIMPVRAGAPCIRYSAPCTA